MMVNKYIYQFIIAVSVAIFTLSILSFSIQNSTDQVVKGEQKLPALLQGALDARLAKFRNTILEKCKRKAIEDAEYFVDSIAAEEFKLLTRDTINFPSKPMRPSLPKKIILNDSTGIGPILGGSSE